MSGPPHPIPSDYHTVTPSLTVRGGDAALAFYAKAFGAEEKMRMASPDGKIMHAEFRIGDSAIMLSDEFSDWGVLSPDSLGGSANTFRIFVEDVDAAFQQAVDAGAEVLMPLADQFWGDRTGMIKDPFGHRWTLASRIENPSDEEVERRAQEWIEQMKG